MADDDLSRLVIDLGKAVDGAGPFLRKAIEVTARNVRDTARENAPGSAGGSPAPYFPASITYDIGPGYDQSIGQAVSSLLTGGISSARSTTLRAEIGPDKNRPQGALGNLIEYGSANNAPWGTMHGALQANEDDFERGVEIAISDALRRSGL